MSSSKGQRWKPFQEKDLESAKEVHFEIVPLLIPKKGKEKYEFLSNKRTSDGRRIQWVCFVAPKVAMDEPTILVQRWIKIEDDSKIQRVLWSTDMGMRLREIVSHRPHCMAFLMGIRPNMGRNEYMWIDVDEDTKKRVRTGIESSVHRAFYQHSLAEPRIMQYIFEFFV